MILRSRAGRWMAKAAGSPAVVVLLLLVLRPAALGETLAAAPPCPEPGWFPTEFGLKDHTVFQHDGVYYLASIYLGNDGYEDRFAYAVSPDLCQWQDLGGILQDRPASAWDGFRIWAPYVYQENGTYYMFYTGVTEALAQSIMLATSTDPSDPTSWQRQGVVFQPDHPGMVWGGFGTWSDCRDATVIRAGELYYMYYTGLDNDGGIVGLATATAPAGPWSDQGPILTEPGAMLESPTVVAYSGLYYLLYHHTGSSSAGEMYHYGPAPGGPWAEPIPLRPGWAHEVWTGLEGEWYTSFLTDYTVTIQPLLWDDAYTPARPFIGTEVHRLFVPLLSQ